LTGGVGGALTCGGGAGGTLELTLETAMAGSSNVVGAARGRFDREHRKAAQQRARLAHRSSCKRGGDITRELQVAVSTMIVPHQRDMKAMTQIVANRRLAERVQAEAEAGSRKEGTSKQYVRATIPMPSEREGLSPCGERQTQIFAKSDPSSDGQIFT
jgi:hypothetical protein